MGFETVQHALAFVEELAAGAEAYDKATIGQQLRDLDVYLQHVLTPKAKSTEARRQVESGTVSVGGQPEVLNPHDIQETILLSNTFNLDEYKCVRLLIAAGQQRGVASATAAAAIYYEERRAQLSCLWYLLQSQALQDTETLDDVQQQVFQYTSALLREQQNGKRKMFTHLLQLIQEQQADSKLLPTIIDEQGAPVHLAVCMAEERTSLCQCLVYACQIEPSLPEEEAAGLAKLLLGMADGLQAMGAQSSPEENQASFKQSYTILIAFLNAILPPVITTSTDDAPSTDHEIALGQLASNQELRRLFEGGEDIKSGFHAVAKLAWGVMIYITGDDNNQTHGRAQKVMHAACEYGVFQFVHGPVLSSHSFVDEGIAQKQHYASALHKLVIQFLNAARSHEIPALLARSKEVETRTLHTQKQGADSLPSLLHCLASLYKLYPDLWLDENIKPDIVLPFMEYLRDQSAVEESATLLVAWLDLLTGMASGEEGARNVFESLLTSNAGSSNPVSWLRMLMAMREYCSRYSQQPDENQEGQQPHRDCLVPPEDVAGLSAFLALFSQVFRDGAPSQVGAWISELQSESSISPLWEVMFQLMCHPVPQKLKAACNEAIGVLVAATGHVSAMWDRLQAAVVVTPGMQVDSAVGQYDISYQLAEIEARAEDYSETLAFVRLLNALWKASGPGIHDGGRLYAHFSHFVLNSVLAYIGRRQYKNEVQKDGSGPGWQPGGSPPGLSVMMELLRGGNVMKSVMQLADEGVEHLLEGRGKPAGAAREATLLGSLRVLVTALQTDVWLLQELRQVPSTGHWTETLDAVLKHDSRRISKLISCVGYNSSSAVQVEAIRLAHFFAARQPTLADTLVQQKPTAGSSDIVGIPRSATWPRLRFAFAGCLQSAFCHSGSDTLSREEGGNSEADPSTAMQPDPRAVLILQLLLAGLQGPVPSLTHLLMGFDVTRGPEGLYDSQLDPQQDFSCLAVVLDMALTPSQPGQQPLLYEQCLELLYRLAEQPHSREAMLSLLRKPPYSLLMSQIGVVLQVNEERAPEAQVRAARLYQGARLLQLAALELHCADLAVQDTSCRALLQVFFLPLDTDEDSDDLPVQASSHILYILQFLGTAMLQQPEYVNELSCSCRQSLRDMGVDAVLQSNTPVEQGGVLTKTRRGQLCYDMAALTQELKKRYVATSADNLRYSSSEAAEGSDELREACREALRFAQRYNAWLEEAAALLAVVQAWQQLVAVAVNKRFDILQEVVTAADDSAGPEAALQIVHQLLSETLYVLHELLIAGGPSLVLPITQVVEACMARLQEQALHAGIEATTSLQFGMPGGQVPAAMLDLFRRLLAVLDRGQNQDALRPHLYTALLSFMQYCQGRRPAQASPHILTALLKAGKANGSSDRLVADMDDQSRQVERGIAWALCHSLPLLNVVIRDAAAQTTRPAMKSQALTLLASWVVAEPSLAVANKLHQQDLPNRILEDLVTRAHEYLPGPAAGAAVQVIEAQLTLLLRLSSARRSSIAEVTDDVHIIGKLIDCKAIDLEPEEPVLRSSHKHDRRRHITRVLLLILQVVNSELAAKRQSSETSRHAVSFVAQHSRMMQRVLREASVGNLNGWEPGEQEAELAALVLSLVTRLSFSQLSQQPGAPADALREGAHRLLKTLGCVNEASHSPLVQPHHQSEDTADVAPSAFQTLPLKVARLRCALARYLIWEVNASRDFRYQIRPSESMPYQPSLLQLSGMLKQAARDREAVSEERQALLDAIQSCTSSAGRQLALQESGAPASRKPQSLPSLLTTAAQTERQLQQACLLAELLLAVMLQHLAESDGDPSALSRLGDNRALLSLQRALDPTLDYLMQRPGNKTSSTEATEQMARELKGYLSTAICS
ncbi:TPA: hypothetical protein ACH3X1_002702 [Trebouxia sp. C0004]